MGADDGYRFERISPTPERMREHALLLRTAFPHAAHFTEAYLAWEYAANPDGIVLGYDAYRDDRLCAHYATQPMTARLFGRDVRGLLSFNTATHPEHQGRGLFTALAQRTFRDAAREGYEFVIGVANANSTPGFTRKLGFQLVSPLHVLVGIGAARMPASLDTAFERTWSHASRTWRTANPRTRYYDGAGALTCATDTPLIKAQLTCASWPDAARHSSAFGLAHPLTVWMGLAPGVRWRGLAVPLPNRLRPSPLNLIFLDLTGRARTLPAEHVRFDAIDFDAY